MHRIMIVEDDDKIADILASYLERYGYEPVRPSSLQDIKSEFLDACPHLALLDINLPYMDGFYWCRQIRTVSNAPVIFISWSCPYKIYFSHDTLLSIYNFLS